MKRLIVLLLAALLLGGCGGKPALSTVDVDLTTLSSTMIYAQVYTMLTEPGDYLGKTVRVAGNYAAFQDEATGKVYTACMVADALACCSQGIEFVPAEDWKFPEDYPELGTPITIRGVFSSYEDGGQSFIRLTDAVLETQGQST